MKQLSYRTLQEQDYPDYLLKEAPEKVLQFGEGAFLRAFIDDFIDTMNEKAGFNGKVVVVQPRGGHPEVSRRFTQQDNLYTLILRGYQDDRKQSHNRIISSISRCLDPQNDWETLLKCAENPHLRFIVSNTTEAGIAFDPDCCITDAPPSSYPAKLAAFLYHRYELTLPGFWILPCELNDDNGPLLLDCLNKYFDLWQLEDGFRSWFAQENHICSTLVDRIVTGYPYAEASALAETLGYQDALIDTGELFGFWVIEAPESLKNELPVEKAGLPVLITDNHKPYKQRKVRILNGAHTAMVLGAYLAGHDIVRDCMEDPVISRFLSRAIYDEIIPSLDLPADALHSFANAVLERFRNPYIDHALLSIALNSTAKWRARVLPSVQEYYKKTGTLPPCLTASFAFYAAFYHNAKERGDGRLIGKRGKSRYEIKDDSWVLDFFYAHRNDSPDTFISALIHNQRMWGCELAELPGFQQTVTDLFAQIQTNGTYAVMNHISL